MISSIIVWPITAGLISQFAKFFIRSNHYAPNLKNFMAYSGMPSSHSAIVVSLATTLGLQEGLSSPLFAISVIFAFIVIRDALGLRSYLGQHSHVINILIKELKTDHFLIKKYPHLLEKIGHTPSQVAVGAALGILVSVLGYLIF
jgi:uncharacterized protein